VGHVAHVGGDKKGTQHFFGKPQEKRPLQKPMCRWKDNIQWVLREIGCGGVDWIQVVQDAIH